MARRGKTSLHNQGCHEQHGQECPADYPRHWISQACVGIHDAERNEAGADQRDTDDDETAGKDEWKTIARSSKPYQRGGSDNECKEPTRNLKLPVE
jgi:hypothetical protein